MVVIEGEDEVVNDDNVELLGVVPWEPLDDITGCLESV